MKSVRTPPILAATLPDAALRIFAFFACLFTLGEAAPWIGTYNLQTYVSNRPEVPVKDDIATIFLAQSTYDHSRFAYHPIDFYLWIGTDVPDGNFDGFWAPTMHGTGAPYLGPPSGTPAFGTYEGNNVRLNFSSDQPAPKLSHGESWSINLDSEAGWTDFYNRRDTPYINGTLYLNRRGGDLIGKLVVSANANYIRTEDAYIGPYPYNLNPNPTWRSVPVSFEFPVKAVAPETDLNVHAFTPAALANNTPAYGIDTPLLPKTDAVALSASTEKLAQGLVADGVTPLLVHLRKKNISSTPTYRFTPRVVSGGTISPLIVNVLKEGAWSWFDQNGELKTPVAGLFPTDSNRHAFAFVHPIPAEAVTFDPGKKEVICEIVAQQLTADGQPVGSPDTVRFKVRKPHVVLVHGYNANSGTWGDEFLNELEQERFIYKLDYGVTTGLFGGKYNSINTNGSLYQLAGLLDRVIQEKVEGPLSEFADFASTRCDVVCHSQGGVLVRMLCQNVGEVVPVFADAPFRSIANGYRGRFRRIVTIGSPQNGSRMAFYLTALIGTGYHVIPRALQWKEILQPKFNPYGEEIRMINSPHKLADPYARFHTISTTIYGGRAPIPGDSPLAYYLPGLNRLMPGTSITRGFIVLPEGSDGVVDRASQRGGPGTHSSHIGYDVCHAASSDSAAGYYVPFEVPYLASQTKDWGIAARALSLLNGPATDFGPFLLPELQEDAQTILSAIPPSLTVDLIAALLSAPPPQPLPPQDSMSFEFSINPPVSEPIVGEPFWFAEVFGEYGVSVEGLSVEPRADNPSRATVTVGASVKGEVVLYASYLSATGKLIFGQPLSVVSIPTTSPMTGLELSSAAYEIPVSGTYLVEAYGIHANGTRSPLFFAAGAAPFTSSAPAIATVGSDGVLRGLAPGQAQVTITTRGFTASLAVTVTSAPVPVILAHPQGCSVTSGATVELNVQADGGGLPLVYRWRRNGIDIPGANRDSLVLHEVDASSVGFYSVLVSGTGGTISSEKAMVVVDSVVGFGPDSSGYTGHHGPGPSFTDIDLTGTPILQNADDAAISVPLGFAFPFYGVSHTSAYISSNGLITFGSASTDYHNPDLEAAAIPRPTIAVLWDDWYTDKSAQDRVLHATTGEPGQRFFTVQWIVHRSTVPGPQGAAIFQCRLSEATGAIAMFYQDLETGAQQSDRAASATIGIADQGGPAAGRLLQWSFNRESLVNGDVLSFLPAGAAASHAAAWRLQHFGSSAITGQASDSADPDHDGLANLLERALGTDPLHGDPVPCEIALESGIWKFRYTRSANTRAAGTTYAVQCGLSLETSAWSTAEVTETFTTHSELEHVTAILPPHTATKRFARLRVQSP